MASVVVCSNNVTWRSYIGLNLFEGVVMGCDTQVTQIDKAVRVFIYVVDHSYVSSIFSFDHLI